MLQDFLNPIGTLIAFFRPELTKLYRKILKPKRLEITEKGDIRLWFSQLGPLIDIQCELKSIARNITVTLVDIELGLTTTGDKRTMKWVNPFIIHRPWPAFHQPPIQSSSTFKIASDAVTLFTSMFYDEESRESMDKEFDKLVTEWELLVREVASFGAEMTGHFDRSTWNNPELTKMLPEFYKGFHDLGYGKIAEQRFKNLFDLKPGQYQLTINFHVSGWNKPATKFWYFTINEGVIDSLKRKATPLVECACYSTGGDFSPTMCRYNS